MKRLFKLIAERNEEMILIQQESKHREIRNFMSVTVESIWRKFVNDVLGITDVTISIYPATHLVIQFDEWLNEEI